MSGLYECNRTSAGKIVGKFVLKVNERVCKNFLTCNSDMSIIVEVQ